MTYDIEPPPESSESSMPAEPAEILRLDIACISCGYSLTGLRVDAKCPECGVPLAKSLQGDLFEHSDEAYVRKLYLGAKLVIASILFMVILMIVSFGFQMFVAFGSLSQAAGTRGEFVATALGVLASFIGAFGWWSLSEPNPRSMVANDGMNARMLVRIMVVTNVVIGIVSQLLVLYLNSQISQMQGNSTAQPGTVSNGLVISGLLILVVSLTSIVTFAVAFFSQMRYLQWVGPRLPNPWVTDRAKLMMWLGPLLFTVGALCIGLGPLVALILYYNLITKIRADLKQILAGIDGGAVRDW